MNSLDISNFLLWISLVAFGELIYVGDEILCLYADKWCMQKA